MQQFFASLSLFSSSSFLSGERERELLDDDDTDTGDERRKERKDKNKTLNNMST